MLLLPRIVQFTALALANQVTSRTVDIRSAQVCNEGESSALNCYTEASGGTPQDVVVADITGAAAFLRSYGAQTRAGRLFTMNAADTPDCGEWSIYKNGSVLITAKHLSSTVNSSVLFADIANTVDGGVNATKAQNETALISCGTDGGSVGVKVNTSSPAYHSAAYIAGGFTTDGILIEVVANLGS